jgi:hypothetical protein
MMKRFVMVLAVFAALALALPAMAVDVKIKGDFNNRFMVYTNHYDWVSGSGEYRGSDGTGLLNDGNVDETFGEAKYRMWFDASTNDGKVKGVWAMEVGALKYGSHGSGKAAGGSYSGDGVNMETRWLYTQFQLPACQNKAQVTMGLQPFSVNSYLWQETVMGVVFNGSADGVDYQLAWLRPWNDPVVDEDDDAEDLDAFVARVNFKPADGIKAGFFALYMQGDDDSPGVASADMANPYKYELKFWGNACDMDLLTIGTDGTFTVDNFFGRWDIMYQDGSFDDVAFAGDDYDLQAWFAHVDLGFKMDAWKFTYTFWYASGDDDDTDDDFDGFISVDVDRFDNNVIFEGIVDDNYFTERPYLLDKGFIMNKLAADYKASKKLTLGGAVMYMMTAEDIEYVDDDFQNCDDDKIGFEVDAYLKYKIYSNLEFAASVGYLFVDDAMDYFEEDRDGNADEDIFISSARVRYKF